VQFPKHLSRSTIFIIEVTVQNKADTLLIHVLGNLAVLDDIKYRWFCGNILKLMKRGKLSNSTKMFQCQFLTYLIVRFALKSLTFLSDIPIYSAIGSIMPVVMFMV
jgi:hypothetical protein